MTVYTPEIKEAAKTLHIAGFVSREIRERLRAGAAGVPPVDPSERTIDKWRNQWSREGVKADIPIRADAIEDSENLIYRRILGLAMRTLGDLEDAEINGSATVKDVSRIGSYMKIITTVQYQRAIREATKTRKLTPEEGSRLGGQAKMAEPGTMLKRLAREEMERGKEPVSTDNPDP